MPLKNQNLVTQVLSWAQLRWLMTCLPSKCASISSAKFNRDRFVLSAGARIYVALCFASFIRFKDVTMEEIRTAINGVLKRTGIQNWTYCWCRCDNWSTWSRNFYGNWFCTSRTFLAAKYNREGYNIFDHYTYVICGDDWY